MWGGSIKYKSMLFKTRSRFSYERVIHSLGWGVGFSFVVNCPLGYVMVETIFFLEWRVSDNKILFFGE